MWEKSTCRPLEAVGAREAHLPARDMRHNEPLGMFREERGSPGTQTQGSRRKAKKKGRRQLQSKQAAQEWAPEKHRSSAAAKRITYEHRARRSRKLTGQVKKTARNSVEEANKEHKGGRVPTTARQAGKYCAAGSTSDLLGINTVKLFFQNQSRKDERKHKEARRTRRERSTNDRHRSEKSRLEKTTNRHRDGARATRSKRMRIRRNAVEECDQKNSGRRTTTKCSRGGSRITMRTYKRGGVC